jgi:hypothetical protein
MKPGKWKQTGNVPGPPRAGPVTKVRGPTLTLESIKFQCAAQMYRNSDKHPLAKGDMHGLARGAAITEPEWMRSRKEQFPGTFFRNGKVIMEATLSWPTKTVVSGFLLVSPKLDDKTLSTAIVQFTVKAGDTPIVMVELGDDLPDEVARYKLSLLWEGRPAADPSDYDFPTTTTEHSIYAIYDTPYEADADSAAQDFTGKHVTLPDTVTGTQQRFDKLMSLFGISRRHAAATADDLKDLLWRVHTGVNDLQNPPYFDAIHDRHLTVEGGAAKHFDSTKRVVVGSDALSTDDQWLMWLNTPTPHWNTAACIGYVQLVKTYPFTGWRAGA